MEHFWSSPQRKNFGRFATFSAQNGYLRWQFASLGEKLGNERKIQELIVLPGVKNFNATTNWTKIEKRTVLGPKLFSGTAEQSTPQLKTGHEQDVASILDPKPNLAHRRFKNRFDRWAEVLETLLAETTPTETKSCGVSVSAKVHHLRLWLFDRTNMVISINMQNRKTCFWWGMMRISSLRSLCLSASAKDIINRLNDILIKPDDLCISDDLSILRYSYARCLHNFFLRPQTDLTGPLKGLGSRNNSVLTCQWNEIVFSSSEMFLFENKIVALFTSFCACLRSFQFTFFCPLFFVLEFATLPCVSSTRFYRRSCFLLFSTPLNINLLW